VRLEDSFVLDVREEPSRERPTRISFVLQLALLPRHPLYREPKQRERHCYKYGFLEFHDVRAVKWHARVFRKFTDKEGRVDYGNIDELAFQPKARRFLLEGDWGKVEIDSASPVLQIAGARKASGGHHEHE
jgi:hypothetical protein